MTTMANELREIQKCLKNEYCFELAKKLYQLYITIAQCPASEYKDMEKVVEDDIKTLTKIQSNSMDESFTRIFSAIDFLEEGSSLKKDLSTLSASINNFIGDAEISQDLVNKVISELEDKKGELKNSLPMVHVKETEVMKNALERAISQIFATDIPERAKLKRVTDILDTMTDKDINEDKNRMFFKVSGMKSVNKEVALKRWNGTASGKPIKMIRAKNISTNEEATCFSPDVMSVKACYTPSILYIYFNLLDIVNDKICWESDFRNLNIYRVSADDILGLGDDSEKTKNTIKKLLVVLSIFIGSTWTPASTVYDRFGNKVFYEDGWKECFNWKRYFDVEQLKHMTLGPVNEGSNPKERVDYYYKLHKCAKNILDINSYNSLVSSITINSSKRMYEGDAIPTSETAPESSKILIYLSDLCDPRVNKVMGEKIENSEVKYTPQGTSIYNIIPHVFLYFDNDKVFFIPVGDLKRYRVVDQNKSDLDISMASFMYQSNSSEDTDSSGDKSVNYYYQDIDTLGAKFNPEVIMELCNDLNRLGRSELDSLVTFAGNSEFYKSKLSPRSALLLEKLSINTIKKLIESGRERSSKFIYDNEFINFVSMKKLLLNQECLQATENSAFSKLCSYPKYSTSKDERLHSVEIIADEKNFSNLWLLSINSSGEVTSEVDSDMFDDYISYSDSELGEIVNRIWSEEVLTKTTDEVIQSSIGKHSYMFLPNDNSGITIKRTESIIGNVTINMNTKTSNDGNNDIICQQVYDTIVCDGSYGEGIDLRQKITSHDYSNVKDDYSSVRNLQGIWSERFGTIHPMIKFHGQVLPIPVLQSIDINPTEVSKVNVNKILTKTKSVNFNSAKVMTNTRDALMNLLEEYKRIDSDSVLTDDILYDYIFAKYKDDILDSYFTRLHKQLRYDIKNSIKPVIDDWFNGNVISGSAETEMLENIINYKVLVTGSMSETTTMIPRDVIDPLINVLLLFCKCGKNVKFYRGDGSITPIAEIDSLELSCNTLDYDKITLQDLWGYNLVYDSCADVLANTNKSKAYLEGTDVCVAFKLSDKTIGSVYNSLVRLMFGVTSLLSTIPEEEINILSTNTTNKEEEVKDNMIITDKVSAIYNVNDNADDNDTTVFNWDELIDWDNSLTKETDSKDEKRKIFNSWMREYVTYMKRVADFYYKAEGISRISIFNRKGKDVDKDLQFDLVIASMLKILYNGRKSVDNQELKKPTVDEWFNLLFYVNSDMPDSRQVPATHYAEIYDDYILNKPIHVSDDEESVYIGDKKSENKDSDSKESDNKESGSKESDNKESYYEDNYYIGDVILYRNGIFKSDRLTEDVINKYKNVTPAFKATKAEIEDLDRFDDVCKKAMAYYDISYDVVSEFIIKVEELAESIGDTFIFTEEQAGCWLAEIGAYAPDRYIRRQEQFVRTYEPTFNKIPTEGYSLTTNPTFSRDCIFIYNTLNLMGIKDLCPIGKSKIVVKKDGIRKKLDLNALSLGELVDEAIPFIENALNVDKTYQSSYMSAIELGNKVMNIFKNSAIKLPKTIKEHIVKTYITKITSICQTNVDICFAIMTFKSEFLKSVRSVLVSNSIEFFKGLRFKPELKSSEIGKLQRDIRKTMIQYNMLNNLREFCLKQDLSDIYNKYRNIKQSVNEMTYSLEKKMSASSRDKKQAILSFKSYLSTGSKENYKKYLSKERLDLLDEDLLFCNNWDGTYKVPSPFSVRSLVKSLSNLEFVDPVNLNLDKTGLDVSLLMDCINLDRDESLSGLGSVNYKPSALYECYYMIIKYTKASLCKKEKVQPHEQIALLLQPRNSKSRQPVDVFAIYDAFAQAYMQAPNLSDSEIAEQAKSIYDTMNNDIQQEEKQRADMWFDKCHYYLDEDVAKTCEIISEKYDKKCKEEESKLGLNNSKSQDSDIPEDKELEEELKAESQARAEECFSPKELNNMKEYKFIKEFIADVKDIYMSLLSLSVEELYKFAEMVLVIMFTEVFESEGFRLLEDNTDNVGNTKRVPDASNTFEIGKDDVINLINEIAKALVNLPNAVHVKMTQYVVGIPATGRGIEEEDMNKLIELYNNDNRLKINDDRFLFDYEVRVDH